MFAVVANGFQTIVSTTQQLDTILALFPYPKFQKVKDEVEGREWIRANSRLSYKKCITNYGGSSNHGYVEVEYFIHDGSVFYNVITKKIGFLRLSAQDDVFMDSRPELIKVKIPNVNLDDLLIAHHVIAISRMLKMIGPYVDVVFDVPDMSVFLAMTKYTGNNYVIKRTREQVDKRLGEVSYTVVEGLEFNRNQFEELFDL